VLNQLGNRVGSLKEKVIGTLISVVRRDINLPYPDAMIVLGKLGEDIEIVEKEFISNKLVTVLCSLKQYGSQNDREEDRLRRSKEAGEALQHLYEIASQKSEKLGSSDQDWSSIRKQLCSCLLDPSVDNRIRTNIASVVKCIVSDKNTCRYLVEQMQKSNLTPEISECMFDTVREISRRMGYRVYGRQKQIQVEEWDQILEEQTVSPVTNA
jgi:hypothetical protein